MEVSALTIHADTPKLTSNHFLSFIPCVFVWSHWSMAYNVFWGGVYAWPLSQQQGSPWPMPDPGPWWDCQYSGGSRPPEITSYKKNQPYTKWVKHVAKQMHLIANVGFKETG